MFFFFKQKTAYERRISDWSSDVCSSDLACAQSATGPVEGHDYVVIPDGQRWSTADDRIEVAEVFAYTCHHCADFEPTLAAWKRKQPADVRVDYVPAAFRPTDNYARAAFAFGQM